MHMLMQLRRQCGSGKRHPESGQTILLVALAIVSLLGMAALAIDVVTLYVARTEIQRAADVAALAGAKAVADSGFTTLPTTDPRYGVVQGLANTMAIHAISVLVNASPPINLVAGAAPQLVGSPTVTFPSQGNVLVSVTLSRSNLPTFFSKIFGRSTASVVATAVAEAYNPANLANITPIAPTSVKPWLVANADPTGTAPKFVDTTTWTVDSGVIGKSFDLVSDCGTDPTDCLPLNHTPPGTSAPLQVDYVPAAVTTPNTANVCPLCAGATDYEQAIECADVATSYQVLLCGGGTAHAQWDHTVNPGAPPGNNATALGGVCLTHASTEGAFKGQDELLDPGPWPSAPFQYKAHSGLQNGHIVSTSNSVVTIPILDTDPGSFSSGISDVTVVGFLQAFINQVDDNSGIPPAGSINITVLNIAGCSSTNNGAPPVVGGAGTSPVPVRLITPP